MAEFDPDAYLGAPEVAAKPADFNPDAYLKETAPVVSPTGRERQHTYRESLRLGLPDIPAGQAAPGPDLSSESHSAGKLADEYGQIGKGIAKGVPATLAGGLAGDVEGMVRWPLNKAFGVSQDTVIPTTHEGGYFGPKGLNIMKPAQTPLEGSGMTIGSMIGPGAALKAVRLAKGVPKVLPEDLPIAPPGSPVATTREGSGARLLPSDVPHVPLAAPEVAADSRSLGAAGVSPLKDVSPETISQLRKTFAEEGVTPWTVEQRLDEMSPHQMLGEFSPLTETHMGAVAAPPGAAKLEVVNALGQRAKEAKDRLKSTFDQAFGEAQNVAQIRRSLEIDQKKAADPFYQKFRETQIPSTQELQDLIPRLEAADAFGVAKHKASLEGIPWKQESFSSYGPISGEAMPTAQSWDYVKRALDHKIAESFDKHGKATDYTRIYTQLKNDLVNAIDNHPNPNVAGVWREARNAYAGPSQIKDAQRMGQKILTSGIDADELPFMTASYSEAQMAALRTGIRKDLQDMLGSPGKQELKAINRILSENNQQKLRWVLGDQETNNLVRGIEHEFNMHGAPNRIHGNSPTALRLEAQKQWTPQNPIGDYSAGDVLSTAVGAVAHPYGAVMKVASKFGLSKHASAQEAKFAKMRDEAARIYTLQGPERDAVIRYLTAPETPLHAKGGRVLKRADGGKTNLDPIGDVIKRGAKDEIRDNTRNRIYDPLMYQGSKGLSPSRKNGDAVDYNSDEVMRNRVYGGVEHNIATGGKVLREAAKQAVRRAIHGH